MTLLSAIWTLSLAFAGLSVAAMLLLTLRRAVIDRRAARQKQRRRELIGQVLQCLDQPTNKEVAIGLARRYRAELLGQIAEELLELVRGDDQTRLAELLEQAGALDWIIGRSTHRRPSHRLSAANVLAHFSCEPAIAALRARLQDPEPEIRITAALALANLGAAPPLPELIEKQQVGAGQSSFLLRVLFRSLVPEKTSELCSLLSSRWPADVIVLALDALGRSGDYQVVPEIAGMTDHPDPKVRAAAVAALGRLGHPASADAVMARFDDPAWPVRMEAAHSSGQIGLSQAVGGLSTLLDDPQWWVRYRAAEALTKLGRTGREILEGLSRGTSDLADLASSALVEFGRR